MRNIRKILFVIMLFLFISSWSWAVQEDEWLQWRNTLAPQGQAVTLAPLTTDGSCNSLILLPEKPTSQEEKAAQELQHWLKEITTAQIPIIKEGTPLPVSRVIISIGKTQAFTAAGLEAAAVDLEDEGYGIAVKDGNLFLWGGRTRGPINAVFALLEEDLGCRWYSDEPARLEQMKTLLPAPVPRTYKPKLKLRDPFYYVSFNVDWSLRNRTNAPWVAVPEPWGGRMDYGDRFVHTFHSLLPPDKYFHDHPEYYMLGADGKRNPHQLCTTNPEVVKLVIEEVKRYLQANPDTEIVSVSKSDGGLTCLCENCKAMDEAQGSNMAALLHLVNAVAEAIETEYPHVLVSTLAYLETVGVPKTMRPRKNVAIRLCNDTVGAWGQPFTPGEECQFGPLVKAWSAVHDRIYIWDYVVNFSHYLAPMPNLEVIDKNIKFLMANHAEGIMTQGAYQSPGAERDWLRSWVIAKLMWDPSRDLHELMRDFIWGYYGRSAPAMAEYNELLRQQGLKFQDQLSHPAGGIRYGMDNPFLTPEFLDQAGALLDKAEGSADNDDVRLRVQRDRLPILYVKLMRGPNFVGRDYGMVLEQFEKIARRVGVTHLEEGGPDLDNKLQAWRTAWQDYQTKQAK